MKQYCILYSFLLVIGRIRFILPITVTDGYCTVGTTVQYEPLNTTTRTLPPLYLSLALCAPANLLGSGDL